MTKTAFDAIVIGGGPAGQKAAIQGAKCGKNVLLIEQEVSVGGACVHRGTIPSKTLRETAAILRGFRQRSGDVFDVPMREDLQVASLMMRMELVVKAHARYMSAQLDRNHVTEWHGRARFVGANDVETLAVDGSKRTATAPHIFIATGSRPRTPPQVPVDHENILDSDSILSMTYLPRSLCVLGAGVIASEYASIFAALGTKVTMVDAASRPVGFLDPELTSKFVEAFERMGGTFLGEERVKRAAFDGVSEVVTTLESGKTIAAEKVLCALGRVANVESLGIELVGLTTTNRGLLQVDSHCRTTVPHIYAIGDVIGPPSLASTSMEQGRRAMCHALNLPVGAATETIPVGVYTIPEMASVGLSEEEVCKRYGSATVGRARFEEIARGQIAAIQDGLLKLVADPNGDKVLGVQIVGEGAAELIHVGQMALLSGFSVQGFVDNIFNFPTLAEAYRVAALDLVGRRARANA